MDFKTGYIIYVDNGMGKLGKLPWGWEIPEFIIVRNPEWFEEIQQQPQKVVENLNENMTTEETKEVGDSRIESIKQHFKNIKEAHLWCMENFPSELGVDSKSGDSRALAFLEDKLLPAMELEYNELEKLGVERAFSVRLFIFGGRLLPDLWEQYKNG